MLKAVADTHALIWYFAADPRLSSVAKATFEATALSGDQIGVSSISLVEMVYLIEKGRIASGALNDFIQRLLLPNATFVEIPVNLSISQALSLVPRDQVPDMPDRIIAATAAHLSVPVISRDGKIQLSAVPTIW